MDPRLLSYYNGELKHLREMGGEFAKELPKIAGRLGLDSFECTDPYVERLIEGFAFLAARVHLKIDSQFSKFTNHLLELVVPHYLRPTPSMVVAELKPNLLEPGLMGGFSVPRGTSLRSMRPPGSATACEYRTGHDCTLWPIEVVRAEYGGYHDELGAARPPGMQRPKGAFRIRLRATAGLKICETGVDELTFYLKGDGEGAVSIYQQLIASHSALVLRPSGPNSEKEAWTEVIPEGSGAVRPVGFEDDEALLPSGDRSFSGYRLLQEYFAFPKRFLFVKLSGLREAFARCQSEEIEIVVLTNRRSPELDSIVSRERFALFCVPAINLFSKQADPILLNDRDHEFHVVPDRSRPYDFEVFSLDKVSGYGKSAGNGIPFYPLYGLKSGGIRKGDEAFYTLRRQPRKLSSKQRVKGPRSSYIGSEVFLGVVDGVHGPFRQDLRQLSIQSTCTNRDLPLLVPLRSAAESGSDFTLDSGAPVDEVRCIEGPSLPRASHVENDTSWRVISHLSLNYLSLSGDGQQGGADALREMLSLYSDLNQEFARTQIEGLVEVHSKSLTRRLPVSGPPVFGRGLEVTLGFDDTAFVGSGAFLLAAVLERFLARYVSINGFSETVMRTVQRGEVARWPARLGRRPVL